MQKVYVFCLFLCLWIVILRHLLVIFRFDCSFVEQHRPPYLFCLYIVLYYIYFSIYTGLFHTNLPIRVSLNGKISAWLVHDYWVIIAWLMCDYCVIADPIRESRTGWQGYRFFSKNYSFLDFLNMYHVQNYGKLMNFANILK